ncbi:MAG: ATP-binding cassette domain-containing protein [Megasphaera sp.]|jgi:phosphate transport system ATP-binding protein|nr:ATP-binding cassette domain-containing protein [Megasphaera sp.]MCI1248445.1 ATP-binding cassette domain-containing protein [Megasphaera sp.]
MDISLQIEDVSVTIRGREILHHITLPIYAHKVTAIIGMSGCGKTTLLKSVNRSVEGVGVDIKGDIRLAGKSVFSLPQQRVRKAIGLIFQKATPFPFSIYKNMSYALEYEGVPDKEKEKIIVNCLHKAGLYDEVADQLDRHACELSGGQQQRLCIARALAARPEVLLLDEPCSSLDIKNMLKIEETIQSIKKDCTVIIVTHNLSQARRLADYTVYMEAGRIIEYSDTATLFMHASDPKTQIYLDYIQ